MSAPFAKSADGKEILKDLSFIFKYCMQPIKPWVMFNLDFALENCFILFNRVNDIFLKIKVITY